jgi:hypothetical protein
MIRILWVTNLVAVLFVIAAAYLDPYGAGAKAREEQGQRAQIEKQLYAAKIMVSSLLRRPEGAQFGRVYVGRDGAACGYVRAPGLPVSTFVVAGSWYGINDLSDRYNKIWLKYCRGV